MKVLSACDLLGAALKREPDGKSKHDQTGECPELRATRAQRNPTVKPCKTVCHADTVPHRAVIAALSCLVLTLALAACGGSSETGPTQKASTTDNTRTAVIDIETIGRSEEEQWATLVDRWANMTLDAANTVGELLNKPRDLQRLLTRKAPKLRERILTALETLNPRCRELEDEVPPAPSAQGDVAVYLTQACARFARARIDILDGLDGSDRDVVERGLRRLARGVNAIASAKAALAPAPR